MHSHRNGRKKTNAIEEANNLSTLILENLVGNLIVYKVQLQERQERMTKEESFTFNVSSGMEESDNEKEDIAIISRKFRKFLKQVKFMKNKKLLILFYVLNT